MGSDGVLRLSAFDINRISHEVVRQMYLEQDRREAARVAAILKEAG